MNGAKLRFILGGATLGAILGASYAYYLYNTHSRPDAFNIIPMTNRWEPERDSSATVQEQAAASKESVNGN